MFAKPEKKALKEVSHCPAAHLLRPWVASAGVCDGCHRKVMEGEEVLDCRQCDWYLCSTCRPGLPEDASIWSTVSGFMDSLAQDFSDVAAEMGIDGLLKSNNTILKDNTVAAPVSEFDEEGVPREVKARTERKVADFCESHPATRVEPNAQELGELAAELARLPQGPAARTLCEQLSWAENMEWQPKLRALCAIEYLHRKGGSSREIAETVQEKAEALIRHLESDLRCKDQAARTLSALSGEAAPAKAEDLMSFDEPRPYSSACGGA